MNDSREASTDGSDPERRTGDPVVVTLAMTNPRNEALLTGVLSEYDVVATDDRVPDRTDLCVVDPGGFSRLAGEIERWKAAERPAVAPALLLSEAAEPAIWDRYGDAMGQQLDAVQSIPVPKRAIVTQIRGLLATRRYSLAAKRRHERLELYERAMNGANVGITIADASHPDEALIYVNDGFEDLTGYGREEAIGHNCRFLQGEGTDPATVDRIRNALAAKDPISVEIRNYRKSGEPFWNEVDIVPVTDDDGSVTHFLGFQDDITDRRRRETDLERYEQVLQSLDDPVVVSDRNRRVELANEAAKELFGSTLAECVSFPSLFPAEERETVRAALSAVERSGDTQQREVALTGAETERIYQFRFQRERGSSGNGSERIIVIGRDVTTVREYQNRLSVLDRVLRHNLRNKLTVIAGNTDLLLERRAELPAEVVADIIDSIDEAVRELLDLAEAARQFHRSIKPGEQAGTPIDLSTLSEDVVASAERKYPGATIRFSGPDGVVANCPSTIRLCLESVIENSVTHADSSEPVIDVATVDRPGEGTAEIRVADDGPGIPEREREALYRGAETALEHLQGISLWLVNWALRSVGGEFVIEDNDPVGTVVVLRMPRAETVDP